MRILVTGSKGVIGQKLVTELTGKGHDVMGVDLYHADGEIGYIQDMGVGGNYARCDISEYRQLERVLQGFDMVYNCAAEFGRWNGEDYYEQLWKTNAIGLKNIIRLQESQKFRLVHFSSSEVYGDYSGIMIESVMDQEEIKQLNDYAISKWVNEMQIRNSAALFDTETVVVRLFNLYGPGEFYHPYRSVNSKFCYHALNNLPVTVYKGYSRSSTYIDDAVSAISNISGNFKPGTTYNIGTDQEHTIEELVNVIWDYSGADKDLIRYKGREPLTTVTKRPDNLRSVVDLNFKETVCLQAGVKRTIDWMKEYYSK